MGTVLVALGVGAGSVSSTARSDARWRPTGAEGRDAWEGAVVRLEDGGRTSGGVSDGDDWLG